MRAMSIGCDWDCVSVRCVAMAYNIPIPFHSHQFIPIPNPIPMMLQI